MQTDQTFTVLPLLGENLWSLACILHALFVRTNQQMEYANNPANPISQEGFTRISILTPNCNLPV